MSDHTKNTQVALKRQKPGKAAQLRGLLTLLFLLVIAGGAGLYYLSLDTLKEYATEVNNKVIDSEASAKQVQQLQTLESQLSQSDGLISKANDIFATEGNFQSQAIRDVRRYAQLTNLTIQTTTFNEDASTPNSRSFIVEIGSPASYQNFIRFLRGIENNIPKMEVTELKISRSTSGLNDQIDINGITMVIHVK